MFHKVVESHIIQVMKGLIIIVIKSQEKYYRKKSQFGFASDMFVIHEAIVGDF